VEAEFVSIFRWNGSLRIESSMMSRGITWLITVGANMDIRNFTLQKSQIRKRGKIGLNQSLIYTNPCNPLLTNFFYFPLFISVAKRKNCSLVEQFLEGHFPFQLYTPKLRRCKWGHQSKFSPFPLSSEDVVSSRV
jgi:hypothetical protein